MKNNGKRFTAALFVLFIFAASCVSVFADTGLASGEIIRTEMPESINARYGALYEATTDTLLYAKDIDRTNAPASMTKVMTAILVLEYDPELKGTAAVSAKAVSDKYCYWMDTQHLLAGEECKVEDLMNYLLICSGNEAATTLAEYVAGDIDAFIEMMNAKAQELGMTKTHYFDPHGLSDDSRTSCEDMLILGQYAMQNETFRKIVRTKSGVMPANSVRKNEIRYSTTNRVMNPKYTSEYQTGFDEDILGIKTGSTTAAGLNLLCCMQHDDLLFYSCVMHGSEHKSMGGDMLSGHYTSTVDLMTWARSFKKYGMQAGTEGTLDVGTKLSLKKNIRAKLKDNCLILVQDGEEPEYVYTYNVGLSVGEGDVVGTVSLTDRFGNTKTSELIATEGAATGWIFVIPAMLIALALGWRIGNKIKAR